MKQILLLVFVLIAFGCSKKDNSKQLGSNLIDTLSINNKTVNFDPITSSDFETVHYDGINDIDSITFDSTKIKIRHDSISIFPKNGKPTTFVNDTTEGENRVIYTYLKTIKYTNTVEIEATYWEWTRIILINLDNGKMTELWDLPNFSPNKEYFVCSSPDLVMGEMPNGFQLFKVNNKKIKLIFEKEVANWEPYDIKWKTDSIIYIKRSKVNNNSDRQFDYVKARIITQ